MLREIYLKDNWIIWLYMDWGQAIPVCLLAKLGSGCCQISVFGVCSRDYWGPGPKSLIRLRMYTLVKLFWSCMVRRVSVWRYDIYHPCKILHMYLICNLFKGTISLKNRHFVVQERFIKLIHGINTIIKSGTWQPVKFQLVSHSWNEMIFYRISELMLPTLIQI